jgi:hypothetical protein
MKKQGALSFVFLVMAVVSIAVAGLASWTHQYDLQIRLMLWAIIDLLFAHYFRP